MVHRSGDGLSGLYEDAHLGVLFMEPVEYRDFVLPFKLFEYLGRGKPIVATAGTLVGDFVAEHGIGWAIPYRAESLAELLDRLSEDPKELQEMQDRVRDLEARAFLGIACASGCSRPHLNRATIVPMRVLAVTPWFPSDQRRGLGLFNLRDVELLARDHEVTVLHLHDPSLGGEPGEWETEFGVRVRRIMYHSSRPRTFRPAAREIPGPAQRN